MGLSETLLLYIKQDYVVWLGKLGLLGHTTYIFKKSYNRSYKLYENRGVYDEWLTLL